VVQNGHDKKNGSAAVVDYLPLAKVARAINHVADRDIRALPSRTGFEQ